MLFKCLRSVARVAHFIHLVSICRNMSMKALIVEEFGDASKLKYADVAKPEPAKGEVRILISIYFIPEFTFLRYEGFWGNFGFKLE